MTMTAKGRSRGRSCWSNTKGGCGHPECKRAAQEYRHEDYRLRRAAQGKPATTWTFVDPERARQHLADLEAVGMRPYAVAKASGVRPDTVVEIVHGIRPKITSKTEARILAVTPEPTSVPSLGARRRLRALCAIGYGTNDIAAVTGMLPDFVKKTWQGRYPNIRRVTHEKIAAVYEELCMIPGPSPRFKAHAAKYGWAPPLAWDDDTIDDPNATPDIGEPSRGLDLDEWWFLVEGGEDPKKAAARCGVSLNAVSKAAYRVGRNDIANYAETNRKRWGTAA